MLHFVCMLYVYVPGHVCVMCWNACTWEHTEANSKCFLPSHLIFLKWCLSLKLSLASSARWWSVSPQDPPFSAPPVLRLQACATFSPLRQHLSLAWKKYTHLTHLHCTLMKRLFHPSRYTNGTVDFQCPFDLWPLLFLDIEALWLIIEKGSP